MTKQGKLEEKHPRGRRTAYLPQYAEQACKLGLLKPDLTNRDLADFFNVGEATIYAWQQKYPEFSDAVKGARARADADGASTLYKRCMGGYVTEERRVKCKHVEYDETGMKVKEWEEWNTVEERRYIPPDDTAIIFWLCNRAGDSWRRNADHATQSDENQDDSQSLPSTGQPEPDRLAWMAEYYGVKPAKIIDETPNPGSEAQGGGNDTVAPCGHTAAPKGDGNGSGEKV